MKIMTFPLLLTVALLLQGCFLTKIATVPMRVGGAVLSVFPVIGNTMDTSIDTAADAVDEIPL
jgi:hypothetical protein